jgi:hypothetical protein
MGPTTVAFVADNPEERERWVAFFANMVAYAK